MSNFKQVLEYLSEGRNIFITGSAGSGKSFLIGQLKEYFKNDLHLTASTGISALNIEGLTIHTWARLKNGKSSVPQILASLKYDPEAKYRMEHCKYLVIDEISMISNTLLDLLNDVLKRVRKDNSPFGGIQLILVGDFLQLPPVLEDGASVCLNCKSWIEASVKPVLLKTNYRHQYDPTLSEILADLRLGNNVDKHYNILSSRFISKLPEPDKETQDTLIYLSSLNGTCNDINKRFFAEIKHPTNLFKGVAQGTPKTLELYSPNYSNFETLELKEGAKVMLTCNYQLKEGLVNGLIGVIAGFTTAGYPIVTFKEGQVVIESFSWKVEDLETQKPIFVYNQIPLTLAYAVTVHKAQGLSLKNVCVDLNGCFLPGQAYTALSRVSSLAGLYLVPFSKKVIKVDRGIVDWYKRLY